MYWESVLKEVLNKNSEDYFFAFTNIKQYVKREIKHEPKSRDVKTYFLVKESASLYLTRREAQCVAFLIQGLSMRLVAQKLGLSRRTVEFYINNIKIKLKCRTKRELLAMIKESEFMHTMKTEVF